MHHEGYFTHPILLPLFLPWWITWCNGHRRETKFYRMGERCEKLFNCTSVYFSFWLNEVDWFWLNFWPIPNLRDLAKYWVWGLKDENSIIITLRDTNVYQVTIPYIQNTIQNNHENDTFDWLFDYLVWLWHCVTLILLTDWIRLWYNLFDRLSGVWLCAFDRPADALGRRSGFATFTAAVLIPNDWATTRVSAAVRCSIHDRDAPAPRQFAAPRAQATVSTTFMRRERHVCRGIRVRYRSKRFGIGLDLQYTVRCRSHLITADPPLSDRRPRIVG